MAGQHRSSTSAAVEQGQQYCGRHGQEGPDWQRLLLPLCNLLLPCSQIDFGMNCCGRAGPDIAGRGAGWAKHGWALLLLVGQALLPCHILRLPRSVATLMAGARTHAGLPGLAGQQGEARSTGGVGQLPEEVLWTWN